jgi:hypothetical protein
VRTPIRVFLSTLALFGLVIAVSGVSVAQTPNAGSTPSASDSFPAWAYPWDPDFKVPPADNVPHRLPGNTAAFSWAQARDLFFAPDCILRIIRRCPQS